MAEEKRRLEVRLSARAHRGIYEIWEWNAKFHSPLWADNYLRQLDEFTERIAEDPMDGRPVPTWPEFRYKVMKKARRSHGHIVVYQVFPQHVLVLSYYHTAQNWRQLIGADDAG